MPLAASVRRLVPFALLLVVLASPAPAAAVASADSLRAPAPPTGLLYADVPNDAGHAMSLTWTLSPDDTGRAGVVSGYFLERATTPGGPWAIVDSVESGTRAFTDLTVQREVTYFYRVAAFGPGGTTRAGAAAGPAIGRATWFNVSRVSVLVFLLAFFLLVLYYMYMAQTGRKPFVRRLAGIDAIEEAIGRATEMGRPVLYVPGIQDIDEIQTVAGLVILESVAKMTARYDTPLRVPVSYPIPFTIAQEMVRSGHVDAGRPDAYDPESVQFVSPEQFAYVAAITGIMLRERPAAHLFVGSFYGESLMLSETGYATGAIQIAATANVHQLPFFVVACDHTLIGEEIFAASAYLSGEARLVGGLKGADMLKLVIVAVVIAGCLLETFGIHTLTVWMQTQ
ncbi:MAG: fibronectin type III domain-containing protein [Candidatus Eisenbacteria bacterium]|uniref:Fibronectin type III domain-containing protein n=1 Tax=Eiseniibacteriota bacterium TaxID=2212470 RepID=A0A933SBL8_UNCEI|nr:fibronectin type III domain-containing protein [Candidatus Eisenbacteria bacterium]